MADSDLLIDVVIMALGVTVWSAVRGVRRRQRRKSTRIGYSVAAGVALLLVMTYLLGSTHPIVSNGHTFDNPLWLRLTDMFLYSSIILIIVCSAITVIARFRR